MHNLERGGVGRVLVVCYGNIYRSPFVSVLLQQRLAAGISVRSAGFHAVPNRPSPARHVRSCDRYGVSLAQHRSCVITQADVEWADLIILMDRLHWAALTTMGARKEKLVWLGVLSSGAVEIPDPFNKSDAEADDIVDMLRAATESLIAVINRASVRGRARQRPA
jgi:protein-tyrosine phosphatase